mgnify:FL=1
MENLLEAKREAQRKAIDSLSRYKFMQFGYWAAIWIHLNNLSVHKDHNPFQALVVLARDMKDGH